jgi:SAM-dependent methyltransferase
MTDEQPEVTSSVAGAVWEQLADFWDGHMRAGRTWQRTLIAPSVLELLDVRDGDRILELGCGNGELARVLTGHGGQVVATDISERMIELARGYGESIDYRTVDATDPAQLAQLGDRASFDLAVSSMVVMDMPAIAPLAAATHRLVRPDGRLVISVLHPAFNSGHVVRVIEETDDERGVVRTESIRRSTYIRPETLQGVGVEGQPVAQWYFHRSLQDLLRPFLDCGWVMDGLREPVLDGDGLFAALPGVLVVSFRRPA